MHIRGQEGMLAELGGPGWGLLPALFFIPWISLDPGPASTGQVWFLLLAGLMASYDLACRRIPNALTALTALAALAWGLVHGGSWGLGQAALGGLTAFGLMAVFFFTGAVGGGDVKALGALGAFLGPFGALELFVFTTLAGGLLALLRLAGAGFSKADWQTARLRLGGGLSLPYGLAILAGALLVVMNGGLR